MKDTQIARAFMSEEVQKIVKRSVNRLVRKYDERDIEKDELINQSYLCFHALMKKFKYEGQIEDYSNLPTPALGYVGTYLPLRLEDYIWDVCGIQRTKSGYKKARKVEFDPAFHGGSEKGKFEKQLEIDDAIDNALFEISDNQRDLIIMEFFRDMTPTEVADDMKVKPSTYRKRKHDSLVALHKVMVAEQDLLQEVI